MSGWNISQLNGKIKHVPVTTGPRWILVSKIWSSFFCRCLDSHRYHGWSMWSFGCSQYMYITILYYIYILGIYNHIHQYGYEYIYNHPWLLTINQKWLMYIEKTHHQPYKKLPSGYDIHSLPWKDPPVLLRTVNHLFRLGPSIPWLC